MGWWDKLIERRIRKAQTEGALDELPGAGKPLRIQPASGDAALQAGYQAMAAAGVLPEEIKIKKELDALRAELAQTLDPEARKALMGRFADAEIRHNIAREARKRLHEG